MHTWARLAAGFLLLIGTGLSAASAEMKLSAVKKACAADTSTFCAPLANSGVALTGCLESHHVTLRLTCRQALHAEREAASKRSAPSADLPVVSQPPSAGLAD